MNTIVCWMKWIRFLFYVSSCYMMFTCKQPFHNTIEWLQVTCVTLDLFDIPYLMVTKSQSSSSWYVYGITAHHLYVVWLYFMIRSIPIAYSHIITYAVYHVFANMPIQSVQTSLRYLNGPLWSMQIIIPCIVYTYDIMYSTAATGGHWSTMIMYWKALLCVTCLCTYGVLRMIKKQNDLGIFITWSRDGENEMRKVF
jgi:hypothetical protein